MAKIEALPPLFDPKMKTVLGVAILSIVTNLAQAGGWLPKPPVEPLPCVEVPGAMAPTRLDAGAK